jgi:hypothetical protein
MSSYTSSTVNWFHCFRRNRPWLRRWHIPPKHLYPPSYNTTLFNHSCHLIVQRYCWNCKTVADASSLSAPANHGERLLESLRQSAVSTRETIPETLTWRLIWLSFYLIYYIRGNLIISIFIKYLSERKCSKNVIQKMKRISLLYPKYILRVLGICYAIRRHTFSNL